MENLILYMLLIWCLLNIISLGRSLLLGHKSAPILSCGIVAFCGDTPADPNIIRMLMMYNMSRGEDSTGWAVNNKVEKATDKVSTFLSKYPLVISPEDDNYTIIAHARKASSGAKFNVQLAHPFLIYREGIEKDKADLILAMNGTLSNTEEMASEFGVEYKHNTNSDTQVMATAMAKLGDKEYIKVIESYEGTATLVFFNPRYKNTLMVFKDPQRELFRWQKSPSEMYVSSMRESFLAIGAFADDIHEFENEHLFRINKGKITKDDLIIKTPIKVKPKYTKHDNVRHYKPKKALRSIDFAYLGNLSVEGESFMELPNIKNPHSNRDSNIYLLFDMYWRNGHKMHGAFITDDAGLVLDSYASNPNAKTRYFINGHLMRDKVGYDNVIRKCLDDKKVFDLNKFVSMYMSENIDNCEYPQITMVEGKQKWVCPSSYAYRFNGNGSKITIHMYLAQQKYTLLYRGECTAVTKKSIAELVDIEDIEVLASSIIVTPVSASMVDSRIVALDKIKSTLSIADEVSHIDRIIEEDELARCSSIYAKMRLEVYKSNPYAALREHFYYNLIGFLFNKGEITDTHRKTLIEDGKLSNFGGSDFEEMINRNLVSYVGKVRERKKDKKSVLALSSPEKVKQLDNSNSALTEEDVVETICDSNKIYAKKQFREDILDAKMDFEQLLFAYASDATEKCAGPVIEACMLCYKDVGFIELDALLRWIERPFNDRITETRTLWSKFKVEFDGKQETESVAEEEMSEEEFEDECANSMNNLHDSIKEQIATIEEVDEENRTSKVKSMLETLTFCEDVISSRAKITHEKNKQTV